MAAVPLHTSTGGNAAWLSQRRFNGVCTKECYVTENC
jgi:hypothetical protein